MGIKAFTTLQILGIVATWSGQALSDGRITIKEAVGLAGCLAEVLNIPVDIDRRMLPEEKEEGEEEVPLSGGESDMPKRVIKPEE